MKKILFLVLLVVAAESNNKFKCLVDGKIMYSYLMTEARTPSTVGYEYLISFNNKKDVKKVKKLYSKYFLNNRNLDCKNSETCVYILDDLISKGITNLDLGAYQRNYNVHKVKDKSKYFNLWKSHVMACKHVYSLIKEFGYTWYALGCYHSKTPSLNAKYVKKLKANYYSLK